MAIDVLKLFEKVQNGEGNKRTGITKEIIETTVEVMTVLKKEKKIVEIERGNLEAVVKAVMADKKGVEKFRLNYSSVTYAWSSKKAEEAGLKYDDEKKVMKFVGTKK